MLRVPSLLLSALGGLFLVSSCDNQQQKHPPHASCFLMKDYFEKEASRLNASVKQVKKTITNDGKSETKNVSIGNWKTELKPFMMTDIGQAGSIGNYTCDTLFIYSLISGEIDTTVVTYTAINASLPIKRIRIELMGASTPVKFKIQNEIHNPLYSSSEELTYWPGKRYMITGKQKTIAGETTFYQIETLF